MRSIYNLKDFTKTSDRIYNTKLIEEIGSASAALLMKGIDYYIDLRRDKDSDPYDFVMNQADINHAGKLMGLPPEEIKSGMQILAVKDLVSLIDNMNIIYLIKFEFQVK